MKKLSAIILAAVLLFSLAACSDKEETDITEATTEVAVETTAASEEETTTEPVSEPETEEEPEPEDELIFSGSTVADNRYCKILISEISENSFGTSLTVVAENKTSDMNLCFTTKSCCVNGILIDTVYAETLSAGEKSTSTITFLDDSLKENGITKYTNIEIAFRVFDADNLLDNDVALETVRIYPYGESKSESYKREQKETDITVFNTAEASAAVIGYSENLYSDYSVEFYLENRSADTNYTFSVLKCAVNGVEVNFLGTFTVPAGKVAFETLEISDPMLEKNGITDFSDIYIDMHVYDADAWDADDVTSQSIHVYPDGQENAATFKRQPKDTDTVVVDNESITVIITGLEKNDLFSSTDLCFYIENKTNESITFLMNNVLVNSNPLDPLFIVTVSPGHSKFVNADWYSDELSENNIEEITSVEFTLTASSADDWEKDDYFNDKVIYNP